MLGSVTGAVYIVGGQLLALDILYTAIINKALSYFGAIFLVLSNTNTSGLQSSSADPSLELLVPLLQVIPKNDTHWYSSWLWESTGQGNLRLGSHHFPDFMRRVSIL